MPTDAVVIGAGGFGRGVLDVIEAHNAAHPDDRIHVLGIADDAPDPANLDRLQARGYRYLGTVGEVIAEAICDRYVLAIGSPAVLARIDGRMSAAGWRPLSVIHPTAVVGSVPTIGEGTIMCAGVTMSTNVTFGRHVHLNLNVTIGHDAVFRDYVQVNPGALISGAVEVGAGALVGTGAIILQQLTVGADSIIGAGAVVTKPVPDGVVVKGIPGVWE